MLQHTELQQIHTALAERIHIDRRWEFQYTCNFIGRRHLRIDHHRQPELLLDKIQLGAVLRSAYTRNRMAVTGLLCDQTAQQIQLIRACHGNHQIRLLQARFHQDPKACAVALNALLRKEAERAEVHAFYLDTLYNDYLLAAGEITTEQQEQALVVEMLQQYCDRVARYSTAGYSVVIRNIIHYINLHLKEDLTLSTLAARSNPSRSYLSDRLHREVHSNLTDYVTLTRIQFAANLLRYHHYTITQAAQEVGIPVVPYPPVQAHHRRDAIPLRPVESHRGLRDEPAKKENFAAALSLLAILCSMVL